MAEDPISKIPRDMGGSEKEPLIRFGEHWIPAHQAWRKMETASVVADVIDHYNTNFPHLANELTRSTVTKVRQRLKDIQIREPKRQQQLDYGAIARDLLEKMSPEDAIDELASAYNQDIGLRDLIALSSEDVYLQALRREAIEYEQNRILAEQTAQIWNEMTRPAPGGGLWSKDKVNNLVNGTL